MPKLPRYFYFRVHAINKGTGIEIEDASDADVVEVVRCQDCIWWDKRKFYCKSFDSFGWFYNAYCSQGIKGERREDETD